MTSTNDFDCVIVGGGLVGTALAIALSPLPLRIALIEPNPVSIHAADQSSNPDQANTHDFDRRAIALSQTSINILHALHVWENIAKYATPIRRIHVSEQYRFGKTVLDCRQQHLPYFGQVVPMNHLQSILSQALTGLANVTVFCPDQLADVTPLANASGWCCQLTKQNITADCLIACDGSRSMVRSHLGIDADIQQQTQVAVLANIEMQHDLDGCAYQRFTPAGPVALLPIGGAQATAVITTSAEEAKRLVEEGQVFADRLQERFGFRLGRIQQVGNRQQHPLIRLWAKQATANRAILLGNAAHTLHPVAAQGFNLSLRDIAVLAELIAKQGANMDWSACLLAYEHGRKQDQQQISDLTEYLLQIFSLSSLPAKWLRSVAMTGLNHMPVFKHQLARIAMGMNDESARRLVYGMPLACVSMPGEEKGETHAE